VASRRSYYEQHKELVKAANVLLQHALSPNAPAPDGPSMDLAARVQALNEIHRLLAQAEEEAQLQLNALSDTLQKAPSAQDARATAKQKQAATAASQQLHKCMANLTSVRERQQLVGDALKVARLQVDACVRIDQEAAEWRQALDNIRSGVASADAAGVESRLAVLAETKHTLSNQLVMNATELEAKLWRCRLYDMYLRVVDQLSHAPAAARPSEHIAMCWSYAINVVLNKALVYKLADWPRKLADTVRQLLSEITHRELCPLGQISQQVHDLVSKYGDPQRTGPSYVLDMLLGQSQPSSPVSVTSTRVVPVELIAVLQANLSAASTPEAVIVLRESVSILHAMVLPQLRAVPEADREQVRKALRELDVTLQQHSRAGKREFI
jgi:hypothetical protein